MCKIFFNDFKPFNTWTPIEEGEKWTDQHGNSIEPMWLEDQSTGRKYFNESENVVGFKCFLLTIGTPFVHSIASTINIAYRAIKIIKFLFDIKVELSEVGKDILKLVASPLALPLLELSALYGLIRPYDGRKLYATIERLIYGDYVLAPCFQPSAEKHLLGGNIDEKNAF